MGFFAQLSSRQILELAASPHERAAWRAASIESLSLEEARQLSQAQIEYIAIQRNLDDGLLACPSCSTPHYTRYCHNCRHDRFGKECGNKSCGAATRLEDKYCGACGYAFPIFSMSAIGEDIYTLEDLGSRLDAGEITEADLQEMAPPLSDEEFKRVRKILDSGPGDLLDQEDAYEAMMKGRNK